MTTYSDSFESGFGNWSNDTINDQLDWTRQSGPTGSVGTGPSGASDGSYYLYVEASSVYGSAILNLDQTLSGDSRITFDYHMYGDDQSGVGCLLLEALVSGSWVPFWANAKNQGDQWNTISNLTIPEGATNVRFLESNAQDYMIDVAIDNITVEDGLSLTHPDYSNLETATVESFEDGTTGIFTNDQPTRLIVTNTATPSNNTGPTSASAGSYFCFLEASDAVTDWSGGVQQSYTLTQTSALNGMGGLISFDYHMYGISCGALILWNSTDDKSTWAVLWAVAGGNNNQWNSVPAFGYPENTTHLKFEFIYCGTEYRGDVAIDNISIQEVSGATQSPINDNAELVSATASPLPGSETGTATDPAAAVPCSASILSSQNLGEATDPAGIISAIASVLAGGEIGIADDAASMVPATLIPLAGIESGILTDVAAMVIATATPLSETGNSVTDPAGVVQATAVILPAIDSGRVDDHGGLTQVHASILVSSELASAIDNAYLINAHGEPIAVVETMELTDLASPTSVFASILTATESTGTETKVLFGKPCIIPVLQGAVRIQNKLQGFPRIN